MSDPLTKDECDEPIRLSDGEYAQLIRESVGGKFVQGSFGPGWVGLDVCPSNEWALRRVAEMRGIKL